MRQILAGFAHKLLVLVLFVGAGVSGYAVVADVVSTGNDTYLVTSQANNGWSTRAAQKTKAYERAHAFCKTMGKEMKTISSKTSPRGIGQIAYAEIEFKCVETGN